MSRAVRTLYRLFLRQANRLEREGRTLEARMPVDKEAWLQNGGAHGWATPAPAYSRDALRSLLPWLAGPDHPGTFTPAELRAIVRQSFQHPPPVQGGGDVLDRAFTSLRTLGEQMHMEEASSSCTTVADGIGVRVDVTTACLGRQDELDPSYDSEDGEPPRYLCTYRVRISNVGEEILQLLSRHWVIRNQAGEPVAEVARGARGVVGCTPILKPNTCFQYYSGTDVAPEGGSMEGGFCFATRNAKGLPGLAALAGETFEAKVAPFQFIIPNSRE